MLKVTLSIEPKDRLALVTFLGRYRTKLLGPKPAELRAYQLVLREYIDRDSAWQTWEHRQYNKSYQFKLPMTVAVAILEAMRSNPVTDDEQLFLNKLIYALVNAPAEKPQGIQTVVNHMISEQLRRGKYPV